MSRPAADELGEELRRASRIVVFTGAGVSTESGIPDFRSPGGVWSRMKPIYFQEFVGSEAKRREAWTRVFSGAAGWVGKEPNAGHHAIARLVASGKASLRADLRCSARISGSEGVIELPPFMHCPDWVTVTSGGRTDRIEAGFEGDGLRFEIAAVNRCIAGGLVECPVWPLSESLAIARTMDTARAAMGLAYPGEDVDPSRA